MDVHILWNLFSWITRALKHSSFCCFASKASSSSWTGVRREVHRHTFRIISSSLLSELPFCECRRWGSFKAAHENSTREWVALSRVDHNDVASFCNSALLFNSAKLETRQKISGCMIPDTWYFRWDSSIKNYYCAPLASSECHRRSKWKIKIYSMHTCRLNNHWMWTMTLQSYWFLAKRGQIRFYEGEGSSYRTKCIANEREWTFPYNLICACAISRELLRSSRAVAW